MDRNSVCHILLQFKNGKHELMFLGIGELPVSVNTAVLTV
jgi:hypothetical protein